jgi:hypothetical protein
VIPTCPGSARPFLRMRALAANHALESEMSMATDSTAGRYTGCCAPRDSLYSSVRPAWHCHSAARRAAMARRPWPVRDDPLAPHSAVAGGFRRQPVIRLVPGRPLAAVFRADETPAASFLYPTAILRCLQHRSATKSRRSRARPGTAADRLAVPASLPPSVREAADIVAFSVFTLSAFLVRGSEVHVASPGRVCGSSTAGLLGARAGQSRPQRAAASQSRAAGGTGSRLSCACWRGPSHSGASVPW